MLAGFSLLIASSIGERWLGVGDCVTAGVGVATPTDLGLGRFPRGLEAPPVVNETFIVSPGTLTNESLSPTFLARRDIAGNAGGGFGPGAGGVKSPNIIVTAV